METRRVADLTAEIFETMEKSQTVLVYLEDAGPNGVDAYIPTPITIKPTGLRDDLLLAFKQNGFSDRLNEIFIEI